MCGRYALTLPHDAMAQLFDAAPSNNLPGGPRWNVCPTTQVPVVTSEAGTRRLVSMRWGLLPRWYKAPTDGPLIINARAETVAEKPAFREAIRTRRCIIPASGFYEWTKASDGARLPWYFYPEQGEALAFAGLWQEWGAEGLATCAIVSCAAGPTMSRIHHREPVTLGEADWPLWLGEREGKAAPLMRPAPEGRIGRYRVATAVNSSHAEGPELIEPLAAHPDGDEASPAAGAPNTA